MSLSIDKLGALYLSSYHQDYYLPTYAEVAYTVNEHSEIGCLYRSDNGIFIIWSEKIEGRKTLLIRKLRSWKWRRQKASVG